MSSENKSITDNINTLKNLSDAFKMLQESGFCESHFTILVQDVSRHNVTTAITISGSLLENLSRNPPLPSLSLRIGDIATDIKARAETTAESRQYYAGTLEELLFDFANLVHKWYSANDRAISSENGYANISRYTKF